MGKGRPKATRASALCSLRSSSPPETTAVEVEEESDAAFDESGALGLSLAPLGRQLVRYLPAFFYILYITDIIQATFTQIIFEKTVGTFKDLNGHL